jgi:transcriptional regulator with XRE-family HTH domain
MLKYDPEKFKKLVSESTMSMPKLAKALGISRQSLYNYRQGYTPRMDALVAAAEIFGKPVTYFFVEVASYRKKEKVIK